MNNRIENRYRPLNTHSELGEWCTCCNEGQADKNQQEKNDQETDI